MKIKTMYESESGLCYATEAEAVSADRVHRTLELFRKLVLDWRDIHPSEIADALNAAGYEITKIDAVRNLVGCAE